jgi:hypothetical protein
VTTAEISGRILARIDDDATNPRSVTPDPNSPVPAEVLAAINEGQELFSLLTLCLEATAAFTLTATSTFYTIRGTFTDFLVPLRIRVGAARLRPATFSDLDALNDAWQSDPGDPERYVTAGFNFLAVTPQPANDTSAEMTYAKSPARITDDGFIEIPEQYGESLVKYGIYRVKLKEGAQGLERGLVQLNGFLDDAAECGDFVRARSRAAKYDTLPFELALFDRSRLIDKIVKKGLKP